METVEINLLGKDYQVACPAEERENLLEAARYLDEKLTDAASRIQASGEKVAVMAALNVAHEFIRFQRAGGFDIQGAKRRIGLMKARLDGVLGEQEKLF